MADLCLRAAPVPEPTKPWRPGKAPRLTQVLRVHAGPDGRALRAVRLFYEESTPYGADVAVFDGSEAEALAWAARQALPGYAGQAVVPAVLAPAAFGKRVLRSWWAGTAPVVFDAWSTFGPLAQHVRRSAGGLSVDLVGGGAPSRKRPGRWADNHERPRVLLEGRDGGPGVFVEVQAPLKAKGCKGRRHGAPVVQLDVLGLALGACEPLPTTGALPEASPEAMCHAFGIKWPQLDDPLDQLLAEALALSDLYDATLVELADVAPGLAPQEVWSAGSVMRAALRRAGMADPAVSTATLPGWVLGACAAAAHGGLADASLVGQLVPMALVDQNGTYPCDFSLLRLTPHLAAERFEHEMVPIGEVERLFAPPGFRERLDDRSWWANIGAVFVECEPHGERLPCQVGRGRGRRFRVAPLDLGGRTVWVHAADLIAPALDGALPLVRRAFRVVPAAAAPGLQPVRMPSGASCDLANDDWGLALLRERQIAEGIEDEALRGRRVPFAKSCAVSGGWGIFASEHSRRQKKPKGGKDFPAWSAFGPDGERFTSRSRLAQVPGPVTLWHLAAAVPAACRATVAILRHDVEAAGGTVAAVLTDAVAVVASPERRLVACPGGPHRLPDGTEAVLALSHEELRAILARFDAVLRPWGGPAWKEVAGSLTGESLGLVLGVNRVLLARQDDGELRLTRSCDFGLGDHYLDPTGSDAKLPDGHLRWCAELQEPLLRAMAEGAPLGLPPGLPTFADHPLVERHRVTNWRDLADLRYQLGDPDVPPGVYFGRVRVPGGGPRPVVLGLDHAPEDVEGWPWRLDGEPAGVAVLRGDGVLDYTRAVQMVVVPDVGAAFAAWLRVSDPTTTGPASGLRQLAPVRPERVVVVGKAPEDAEGHVASGEPHVFGAVRRCAGCGGALPPGSRRTRRFCCEGCRKASARGHARRGCQHCGEPLAAGASKTARFCSVRCRMAAHRAAKGGAR